MKVNNLDGYGITHYKNNIIVWIDYPKTIDKLFFSVLNNKFKEMGIAKGDLLFHLYGYRGTFEENTKIVKEHDNYFNLTIDSFTIIDHFNQNGVSTTGNKSHFTFSADDIQTIDVTNDTVFECNEPLRFIRVRDTSPIGWIDGTWEKINDIIEKKRRGKGYFNISIEMRGGHKADGSSDVETVFHDVMKSGVPRTDIKIIEYLPSVTIVGEIKEGELKTTKHNL